jgi:putative DNA primase/helicase
MWDGHKWRRDADAAITRLALDFARRWQREALEIENLQKREAALTAALRLERRDALNSMLALAHDLKPIADPGDGWDLDPHLLGVPNGVVDLRTGQLRPGRQQDKISLSTSIAYDPHARSGLWDDTLKAILLGDELIRFFHAAVGYSATGDTSATAFLRDARFSV